MATLTPQRRLDWIQTAPVQASATRELGATPAEVFAALADHESWPQWFESLTKVERFGDLREGVGSNRRVFVGSRVKVDEEFIVWEPNEQWGFTILEASVPGLRSMNELVTIDPVGDDRSRVTYTMGIEPGRLLAPLLRLARGRLGDNIGTALEKLEEHIARTRDAT
jgi:uncharacterized protein YndB with AHSA1/START domain